MEIWIKSCLINKWMLVELTLRMLLGFLKTSGGSCITSLYVLIKLLELWWFVVSFIIIANWWDYHRLEEVFKKIPFIVQGGKYFFFMKVELPHNVEKQCVLHFSQIGWLYAPTPFDVLHEHFGNIGALDLRFYYVDLKFEDKSIRRSPSSCNLQNWKKYIQFYF